MKIALLAPIEETVPPEKYGGTERVVYVLAEELVALGHDVTLFASADSITSAKLVPLVNKAIRKNLEHNPRIWFAQQIKALHIITEHLKTHKYDIIHNHIDTPFLLLRNLFRMPIVTTVHNPIDDSMIDAYDKQQFISISNSQRKNAKFLKYVATVYNGINVNEFEFNDKPKGYLMYLGRISPDKGTEEAIKIAKKTRRKLIIAAKIDPPDRPYYKKVIKPLINDKDIIFIGEVDHAQKVDLLKNAKALISPIQWEEPFGLINVEALACGTPVITINRGSMPEIIIDGKTGFLCKNLEEMVKRVYDIPKINRLDCRRSVERKFTSTQMAKNYIKAYQKVIQSKPATARG